MVSNINCARCFLETGDRSCFVMNGRGKDIPVVSPAATRFQVDNVSNFQWRGSDYRLSCGGGFCTLQKPVKESFVDLFLQALAGILTLGLVGCSSNQDSSSVAQNYEDVASFSDSDHAELAPPPDIFSTPLAFCSSTNFMAGCLSASEIGQMSTCVYLKGLSTSDGVPIVVPNYSALVSYLDKTQDPWVYAKLDTNNQLPKNIINGKVALNVANENYNYVGRPFLWVDADSNKLKLIFSVNDKCEAVYASPCTTDICNIN